MKSVMNCNDPGNKTITVHNTYVDDVLICQDFTIDGVYAGTIVRVPVSHELCDYAYHLTFGVHGVGNHITSYEYPIDFLLQGAMHRFSPQVLKRYIASVRCAYSDLMADFI